MTDRSTARPASRSRSVARRGSITRSSRPRPATLDAPSTVTLYAGPLKDVAGLAGEELTVDTTKAATPSRLVLIDTTELGWQRARCRAKAHRLLPADPVLVGFTTLQQWLWQRLQVPAPAHA